MLQLWVTAWLPPAHCPSGPYLLLWSMSWPLLYSWLGSLPCPPITLQPKVYVTSPACRCKGTCFWGWEACTTQFSSSWASTLPTRQCKRHANWKPIFPCLRRSWQLLCPVQNLPAQGVRLSAHSQDRQVLPGHFCREVLQTVMKLRACCSSSPTTTILSTYGSQESGVQHKIRSKQTKKGANEVGFAAPWYKNPTDHEKQIGTRPISPELLFRHQY